MGRLCFPIATATAGTLAGCGGGEVTQAASQSQPGLSRKET